MSQLTQFCLDSLENTFDERRKELYYTLMGFQIKEEWYVRMLGDYLSFLIDNHNYECVARTSPAERRAPGGFESGRTLSTCRTRFSARRTRSPSTIH